MPPGPLPRATTRPTGRATEAGRGSSAIPTSGEPAGGTPRGMFFWAGAARGLPERAALARLKRAGFYFFLFYTTEADAEGSRGDFGGRPII